MYKFPDIGIIAGQLLLLVALNDRPAHTTNGDAGNPATDRRVHRIHGPEPGPHCFAVSVPEAGRWWVTLRTRQPSTAPALMVLGEHGPEPRTVDRIEAVLLEVDEPDELLVCSTSRAVLEEAQIAFLRAGDPLEIEVDPDPVRCPSGPLDRSGDPLEIEVDPDP